jgi:hypothetical protein
MAAVSRTACPPSTCSAPQAEPAARKNAKATVAKIRFTFAGKTINNLALKAKLDPQLDD